MTYTLTPNVSYGSGSQKTMDVITPAKPNGAAVILLHPGGWVAGNATSLEAGGKTFLSNTADAFAARGFTVFNLDYTLGGHGVKWATVYASVETALAYIKTTYDPSVIGAVGFSAGAQIASMLGVSGQVAFVGDNSGPADLTDDAPVNRYIDMVFGYSAANRMAASPIDHIGANSAPFFITQGLSDNLVPAASQGEAFNAALLADGVSSTLVEYAGGHIFMGTPGSVRWPILNQEVAWASAQVARLTQAGAAMGAGGGSAVAMITPPDTRSVLIHAQA